MYIIIAMTDGKYEISTFLLQIIPHSNSFFIVSCCPLDTKCTSSIFFFLCHVFVHIDDLQTKRWNQLGIFIICHTFYLLRTSVNLMKVFDRHPHCSFIDWNLRLSIESVTNLFWLITKCAHMAIYYFCIKWSIISIMS